MTRAFLRASTGDTYVRPYRYALAISMPALRFYYRRAGPARFVLCSRDDSGAALARRSARADGCICNKGKARRAHMSPSAPKTRRGQENSTADGLKAGGRDNGGAGPARGL
jgi:hypothetical protein